MTTVSRHDSVFVLRFSELMDPEPTTTEPTEEAGNPENVFSPDLLDSLDAALDEVQASEGPAALVTTGAGRFYSNGLDLGVVASDPAGLPAYVTRVQRLFARVLRLELPTVAAVNGHAFGAGAMLALCADYVVMRTERGFWSLPEAALSMPFPRGMAGLLTTRLPDRTATEAMLTSRRYGAEDAVAAGIVDEAVAVDDLLARASAVADERKAVAGPNLSTVKRALRLHLLEDLVAPTPASLL